MAKRNVFVISDLHLGGDPDDRVVPGNRGFRMCQQGTRLAQFLRELRHSALPVEVVINGDFLDFLAERDPHLGTWSSFYEDAEVAAQVLRIIARNREPEVFEELRQLCAAGHRVIALVGNHDVELALPAVRRALFAEMGSTPRFELVYNNEPLVLGDAIIEHGNHSDDMNRVAWDQVLRRCAEEPRRLSKSERTEVLPPPGSRIVERLMNPLKARYPFVDLLKPETRAALPILVALDPSVLVKAPPLLAFLAEATVLGATRGIRPTFSRDLAARRGGDPMIRALEDTLGVEDTRELLKEIGASETQIDLSARPSLGRRVSTSVLYRVLLRLLRGDGTPNLTSDDGPYLTTAKTLARNGFRVVVLGHTHLARHVEMEDGATYLNTGTWADLIFFPPSVLTAPKEQAIVELDAFLTDMEVGRLDRWIKQRPTYAWLSQDGDRTVDRRLCWYGRASDNPFDPGNIIDPADDGWAL